MNKLHLARLRQDIRALKTRRNVLEHIAMQHHPMLAASFLERRFRPNGPVACYLSIPHPKNSRHRYVRKNQVDQIRRQTSAWREFSHALAEWVQINQSIERQLRQIGAKRCRKINLEAR